MRWSMPDVDGDTLEVTPCTDGTVELAVFNDDKVAVANLRQPEIERLIWLLYTGLEEAKL